MDLLDRLVGHDAWTTRKLFELCLTLPEEQWDREFEMAHRTLRATFDHIIYNLEIWTDCMNGHPLRGSRGTSVRELQDRFELAMSDFQRLAREVRDRHGWDEPWVDSLDGKQRSYGGAIAHVITHNMHHRAQLLFMMRRLGLENLPEGDVLSWESQLERPRED